MKKLEEVSPDSTSVGIALGLTETQDALVDVCIALAFGIRPQKENGPVKIGPNTIEEFLKDPSETTRVSKLIEEGCQMYEKHQELNPAVYASMGVAAIGIIYNCTSAPVPSTVLIYCYRVDELLTKLAEAGIVVEVE